MIFDNRSIFLGFRYRLNTYEDGVWDTYWYAKDVQGDITEIYSSAGVKLIHYGYDAWGNTTVTYSNGGASTTAVKNNLTYRGYYYDRNLGLYYLRSRYYDAKICRFISPDDVGYLGANGDLTSYNLYAYCSNNPINYIDSNGYAMHPIVFGAAIGFAIGLITSIFVQTLEENGDISNVDIRETFFDAAVGGINGAFAASGISFKTAIAVGALIGGATSIIKDCLFNDGKNVVENAIWSAVVGGFCGAIAGAGANNIDDGMQVTKYVTSYEILNKTIANGTNSAIPRQTATVVKHAKELVISGARYLLGNFFAIVGSELGGWWDD